MPSSESRISALTILQEQQDSHDSKYWHSHLWEASIVMLERRHCVCDVCFAEMIEMAEQKERDWNSVVGELIEASNRFVGFDIYEKWWEKTSEFTPL